MIFKRPSPDNHYLNSPSGNLWTGKQNHELKLCPNWQKNFKETNKWNFHHEKGHFRDEIDSFFILFSIIGQMNFITYRTCMDYALDSTLWPWTSSFLLSWNYLNNEHGFHLVILFESKVWKNHKLILEKMGQGGLVILMMALACQMSTFDSVTQRPTCSEWTPITPLK